MKVIEYRFTDYYHEYVTIEADGLTDVLKDKIDVQEEDCYGLCSCWCQEDGTIMFNVLSIGPSWEECIKGLDRDEILGNWTMEEAAQCEARLVDPSNRMIQKNVPYLEKTEVKVDEDRQVIREDGRLDDLRSPYCADLIFASFISKKEMVEYPIRVTGIEGVFVLGTIEDSENHEPVKALLVGEEEKRLIVLAIGEELSQAEEVILDKIKEISEEFHLTYTGVQLRS